MAAVTAVAATDDKKIRLSSDDQGQQKLTYKNCVAILVGIPLRLQHIPITQKDIFKGYDEDVLYISLSDLQIYLIFKN